MPAPKLALVVEDDEFQREILSDFLKEENLDVIQCESAEAAELIIARVGAELNLLVTDFHLAGEGTGLDLAAFAQAQFPPRRAIRGTVPAKAVSSLAAADGLNRTPARR